VNRRRFLKYAGAAAAVVGASALGLDYLARPDGLPSSQTNTETIQSTSKTTSSTSTTAKTTDLQIQLFHDYHGDGQQQSDEPAITDLALDIQGIGNDYSATLQADSEGKYWARDIPVGDRFRISPKTNRFRYVAISNAETRRIDSYYYTVSSDEPTLFLGLMEGFLTLPFPTNTKYKMDDQYDRDPDPSKFLYWNGMNGPQRSSPGATRIGVLNENHYGIDYHLKVGEPLLAQAPGRVVSVGEDSGGKFIWVEHAYGFRTSSGHISNAVVGVGDFVFRGQQVAVSGMSGQGVQAAKYPVDHQNLALDIYKYLDPYAPEFQMKPQYSGYYQWFGNTPRWVSAAMDSSNPNMLGYWSKKNDPKYPVT